MYVKTLIYKFKSIYNFSTRDFQLYNSNLVLIQINNLVNIDK